MLFLRVVLVIVLSIAGYGCGMLHDEACQVCGRPLHEETFFRITLQGGEARQVCCPRCGLHFLAGREDVAHLQTTDYSTGEIMDADEAIYVENSSVMLCCKMDKFQRDQSGGHYPLGWDRCLPSLVSFKTEDAAQEFQKLHGGRIRQLSELLTEVDFTPGHH